CAIRHSSGDVF
nr:immunoglobulin light chain junction region [Macaca mulatta]